MAERIEIGIDVDQNVDKEVKSAAKAIDALDRELSGLDKELGKAERSLDETADAMDDVGDAARKADDDVSGFGAGVQDFFSGFTKASIATAALEKIAEKALEVAAAFASWVGETAISQRQAENLFKSLTKGAVPFERMQQLAASMGVDVSKLTADFAKFSRIEGVGQKDALGLAKLQQDLEALFGADEAATRIDAVVDAIESGKSPTEAMADALEATGGALDGLTPGAAAASKATTTVDGAMSRLKSSVGNALTSALDKNKDKIGDLVDKISELVDSDAASDAISGLVDILSSLISVVSAVAGPVSTAVSAFLRFSGVADAFKGLQVILDFLPQVVSAVTGAAGKISATVGKWVSAAGELVSGFIDGLKAGIGKVIAAGGELAKAAIDAVKAKLGISSPSKVFVEFGGFTSEGFAEGIEPVDVMGRLMPEGVPGPGDAPELPSAGGVSGGGTYEITINVDGGEAATIASAVRDAIDDYFTGAGVARGAL